MASVELAVRMHPDQMMHVGSITKQIVAAALLKLVESGKADLNDPVTRFLPDYPGGDQITLLNLLNHTSGIKNYTAIPGYMGNPVRRDLITAELIQEFKHEAVDFMPGDGWSYNNSGYVLAGAVLEKVSGKAWYEAIDDLLLAPAHIRGVRYPAPDQLISGLARGYSLNSRGQVMPVGLLSVTQAHAAGALVANTEGLWQWNLALHGSKMLPASSYQRMSTPEGAAAAHQYGLGISRSTLRGQPLLFHGGGVLGFVSMLSYLPNTSTTVVVLRNSDAPGLSLDVVARRLAAFAIGDPFIEPTHVAVVVKQLMGLEGTYQQDRGQIRMLRVKDGVLNVEQAGGSRIALIALGKDRFAWPDSLTWMEISRGINGQAAAVTVHVDGEDVVERWARSGDLQPEVKFIALSDEQKTALMGEYASPQVSIRANVDGQGRLFAQVAGQPIFELKASAPRPVYVPQANVQLNFGSDGEPVTSVTLIQSSGNIMLRRVPSPSR